MAVSNKVVTADELISAVVKYSNKDDASRSYDISANVTIQNGVMTSLDNGYVRSLQTTPEMVGDIATFNTYSPNSINFYVQNAPDSESKIVFGAVMDFIADVRTNVSAKPVTA